MNPKIKAAYDTVQEAERELEYLIQDVYHVGDVVCYRRGDHEIKAEVLDHSGDRLKVRGINSGKEYLIYAYSLSA